MLLTLLSPQTAPATTSAILIGSSNNPSYRSGFYSPRRGGTPKYPSLWDGCVGAWAPSLGQTGLTLRDESVFGNHGTLTNMEPASDWVVSGGKGALDFDGTDEQIAISGNGSNLAGLTTATMTFWIFRPAAGTQQQLGPQPQSGWGDRFTFTHFTDNTIYVEAANVDASYPNVAANITGWNSFAFVFDGNKTGIARVSVYINGIPQALSVGGADPPAALPSAFAGFLIGRDASNARYSTGAFDDIRTYNRALTPSEIKLLATRRGIAFESKRRLAIRSGAASPNGTLAKTLDSVTLTSSGTLAAGAATGSLSSTLADASLSSSGTLTNAATGSLSSTLADATLSSSGTLASGLTGSVSVTLADATLSATGTVSAGASGSVTRTLDSATLSSTGGAAGTVTGSVSSTLAAATCSSSGTLAAGLSGTVVRTLDVVTSSAIGTLTNGASGTVTRTLANATLASGGSLSAGLTAQVNRALESCVVSASGTLVSGLTGTLSVQLASATLQSGNVAVGGLRIKVGGEWKNANAFVKVTGTWKNATPFVKVSGVWK